MAARSNIWKWCICMHHSSYASRSLVARSRPNVHSTFLTPFFWRVLQSSKKCTQPHATSWMPSNNTRFMNCLTLIVPAKTSSYSSSICRSFFVCSFLWRWGGHLPVKPSRTLSWLQPPKPQAWNWFILIHWLTDCWLTDLTTTCITFLPSKLTIAQ